MRAATEPLNASHASRAARAPPGATDRAQAARTTSAGNGAAPSAAAPRDLFGREIPDAPADAGDMSTPLRDAEARRRAAEHELRKTSNLLCDVTFEDLRALREALTEATAAGVPRRAISDATKKLKVYATHVRKSVQGRLQRCVESQAPDDAYMQALTQAIEEAEAVDVADNTIAAARKALMKRRRDARHREEAATQLNAMVEAITAQPSGEALDALECALAEAVAAGVHAGLIERARRAIAEAKSAVERLTIDRMQQYIARTKAAYEEGPYALLSLIYREFPPQRPDAVARALQKIAQAKERGIPAAWKPVLMQAQKDYHPDRNANVDRSSMRLSRREWELLSLSISQHVSAMYTDMYRPRARTED